MPDTRIEKDSLGEIEVPAGAYYGAQTERAHRNFPVSGLTLPRRFLAAVAMIKGEAAAVNEELGIVSAEVARAIRQAARRWSTASSTTSFRSTSSRPARAPGRT